MRNAKGNNVDWRRRPDSNRRVFSESSCGSPMSPGRMHQRGTYSALFALALLLSACSPSAPDLKGCDEEFDIVVPDLMICEEGCRIRVRDGRVEITSLDPGDEIRSEVYHWDDDGMLHRVSKTGWPPIITHDLLGKNRRPE